MALTREDIALLEGHGDEVAGELLDERLRQIGEEGWSTKHDERHPPAAFAAAAAAYAWRLTDGWIEDALGAQMRVSARALWPWDPADFKPKDPRRDLVRAGALIIAAIERLDRETLAAGEVEAG